MKKPRKFCWIVLFISYCLVMSCSHESTVLPPGNAGTTPTDTVVVDKTKEVFVWIEGNANIFGTYGRFNDTSKISTTLDTLSSIGVTGIVVDVKGINGLTLYHGNVAGRLTTLNGKSIPAGVDYLDFMIKAGKKRGLKVYASMSIFAEGDPTTQTGKIYTDAVFRNAYQVQVYNAQNVKVPITQDGQYGFVNPANSDVQAYELSVITDLVQHYAIDGFIADYCRYNDINGDFSDTSKNQFIRFLQDKYADNTAAGMSFPGDVIGSWTLNGTQVVPAATGKYYKHWLLYRTSVIYNFMKQLRSLVKINAINPNLKFGAYVGSWYITYYQLGVNWASQSYNPYSDQTLRFDWADPDYNQYGYAEQLDFLMTGNYYKYVNIADDPSPSGNTYDWWSVEGSINASEYVLKNKVSLLGGIDMGNTAWNSTQDLQRAIKMALSKTNKVMLFDLCHIYAPQWNTFNQSLWNTVKAGINN